ncbi:MAG: hypothetical protein JKY42_06315 [Flavobacteriales bacterium]|nr:hypothetical protein [Flavobacteriales bacterium]
MKKVVKVVGVIFVLLIAAIVILPIIFKDDIIQLVKDEANNNLNATVDFGEFDLSIISTFPNFMFSINDVSVVGVDKFEGITLASIGTLQATLDINSVIDGETIKIISFELIDVTANAIVLKDSTANWDIVKSTGEEEETVEEETSTEETKFSLGLEHYAFKNINVVYDDVPGGMYAEIKNFSHEGDGDFTQDIFLLNTITSIESITYRMDGMNYLNKANIEMKFDIEIDNPNTKYTFKENSFRINAFELAFDGWVAMPTDDIELDLSFQTNKPDFKSLLSLVPAVYLTDFSDVKTAGKVAFNGMAKGTYGADGSLPAFDVNLLVEDAMFKYPDLPKSVDNIQIKMNASSSGGSEDNTVVDIAMFHVEMGNNPVDIKMNVKTPISDPDMMGSIKAQVDLASMKEFIPMEEGEDYNGNITMDIDLGGKLSTIENEDYENFKFEGNLIILDMAYKSADMAYDIDMKSLYIEFSPQFVELTSFETKVGKSDFAGKGRVENFLAYTFKDEPLKGTFDMNSNYINVNEFMEEDSEKTVVSEETTEGETEVSAEEGVAEVPGNIDFVMTMNIKEMLYDDIQMKNINGGVTIRDSQMKLDNLFINMIEGSVNMNGTYDTREELPKVDFSYDIKHFDVPTMYRMFNTVKEIAPIAENATGRLSTNLEMHCMLDNKMEVDLNTLIGGGVLFTENIVVENSEALSQLADALQQPKYKKMILNDNKIFYEFRDGRMFLDPFDMKISSSNAKVSGSQGFDESMDYKMAMDIPTAEFGSQANSMVNGLLAEGDKYGLDAKVPERINVDVYILGTVSEPKVSLGPAGGVKPTIEDIKEQVIEEVKEIIEEKVEEVIEDTKEKAREEADKILANAEIQSDKIKKQAAASAAQIKKEGYKQADNLEKEAKNPLQKAAAKVTSDKLRKETDKKEQQAVAEGDKQAKAVMDEAKKQADELLK